MDHSKLTIAQWAEEDKPREKLEALGAEALSKAELLAILIGSGSADEDAVALTKRILADVGDNLYELGKLSIADLQRYKGIGPAKAKALLEPYFEITERSERQEPQTSIFFPVASFPAATKFKISSQSGSA